MTPASVVPNISPLYRQVCQTNEVLLKSRGDICLDYFKFIFPVHLKRKCCFKLYNIVNIVVLTLIHFFLFSLGGNFSDDM